MNGTTTSSPAVDDLAGYAALEGHSLGRREQVHGPLRAIAEISVSKIMEAAEDLAVADRVAFVLAFRSANTYAVVGVPGMYLVVQLNQEVAPEHVHAIRMHPGAPRIISIATSEGVVPLLTLPGST